MSKAVSGYPYYTSTAWKRVIQSFPASYSVWKVSDSVYRAECNVSGGTDVEQTTIESLMNAIGAGLENTTVFIRAGDYPVATGITALNGLSNVNIVLENGARLYRSAPANSYHLIDVQNCENIAFSGGTIDGVANDTTEGVDAYLSNNIHLEDSSKLSVTDMLLDNASDDALWIDNCDDVTVVYNRVIDFYKHAISVYGESVANTCNNVSIVGNNVDAENGQRYDGITVYAYSPKGISIVGNTCRNVYNAGVASSQSGIHVEDPSVTPDNDIVTVSGNTIEACKYGIMSATARPLSITGNAIYDSHEIGIYLFNPCYNTAAANAIQACPIGIYVYGGTSSSITGNIVDASTSYGIHLAKNAVSTVGLANSVVNGNAISNISEDGILVDASYGLDLSHNSVRTVQKHGIHGLIIFCSQIDNNVVWDASQDTVNTYDGIYLEGTVGTAAYWNTISYNDIFSNAGATRYNIHLGAYAGSNTVSFNKISKPGAGTASYYDQAGSNIVILNRGYNPVGTVATPFATVTINPFAGNAAPVASTDYVVTHSDIYIASSDSGNADCAIVIKDTGGQQVYPRTGSVSTLGGVYVPIGFKINWGAYTGAAPTVVVSFT